MRWIVQGSDQVANYYRNESMKKACINLGQQVIQLHKSKKQVLLKPKSSTSLFRTNYDSPLALGMSIRSHNVLCSKNEIDVLAHAGIRGKFDMVKTSVLKIANAV